MGWIPIRSIGNVGTKVELTEDKTSILGMFTKGSHVFISGASDRGYSFKDTLGHQISDAGWSGFEVLSDQTQKER